MGKPSSLPLQHSRVFKLAAVSFFESFQFAWVNLISQRPVHRNDFVASSLTSSARKQTEPSRNSVFEERRASFAQLRLCSHRNCDPSSMRKASIVHRLLHNLSIELELDLNGY